MLSKYFSYDRKKDVPIQRQMGFTLLELLIALTITLIVIMAAQRYVAGVVLDQTHLTEQHDQVSQTYVTLNNIQSDVSRAGFTPIAAKLSLSIPEAVIIQSCKISGCVGDELTISYWQLIQTGQEVKDCVGHNVVSDIQDGWAKVVNTYRVRSTGKLSCSGNGGTDDDTFALLDNVDSHSWILKDSKDGNRLLSVCLTTKNAPLAQVNGSAQPKNCVTQSVMSDPINYRTTEVDFLVRSNRVPPKGTGSVSP